MEWKLSWNKNKYDYLKLIDDYNNNNHNGIILQYSGNKNMKTIPQINDIVYVSCNRQKIMKCKVLTPFFDCIYNDIY